MSEVVVSICKLTCSRNQVVMLLKFLILLPDIIVNNVRHPLLIELLLILSLQNWLIKVILPSRLPGVLLGRILRQILFCFELGHVLTEV